MKTRILIGICYCLYLAATPAVATLEEGLNAYKRGDFTTALRELLPEAEMGNGEAQFYIGMMHEYGRGVAANEAEALQWYERAARTRQSFQAGIRLAAERGEINTQVMLAMQYWDQDQDGEAAMKWLARAAEQGDRSAQHLLATIYDEPDQVPWIGDPQVSQDYGEAIQWYLRAAEQGDRASQARLGTLYYFGEGVRKNNQAAAEWNRRAAEQGDLEAQNNLGLQYEHGEGVPQSFAEALRWYRQAAEAGFDLAQANLALLHFLGNGVAQSYEEAAKWWRLAAAQGYEVSQYNLGLLYRDGQGVPQDNVQALKWMILSGNRGFQNARWIADQLREQMIPVQVAEATKLAEDWTASEGPVESGSAGSAGGR